MRFLSRFFLGLAGFLLGSATVFILFFSQFSPFPEKPRMAGEQSSGTEWGPAKLDRLVDRLDELVLTAGKGRFDGLASWYGERFHGRLTSSKELFDMEAATVAHRWLPFGTTILIVNRKTGAMAVARVNDRGPYIDGHMIDVSRLVARKLGMERDGLAFVRVFIVARGLTSERLSE